MDTTNTDPVQVLQGLALARDLAERTGVSDPRALRAAADRVEELATSALERGLAAGLRIIAADLEATEPASP